MSCSQTFGVESNLTPAEAEAARAGLIAWLAESNDGLLMLEPPPPPGQVPGQPALQLLLSAIAGMGGLPQALTRLHPSTAPVIDRLLGEGWGIEPELGEQIEASHG